ncbi:uncharacterized protein LOC111387572 [Olea europaea var. sylvestris]|uniref:uncharacterized protein LOC111387572 n=1 Tax=Olea europaea var. sylvestris TaxID=158386 RepID=UPI000C1CDE34|nr:uncharacterized protein LOC111387572 [Olea europaea var. sylvestris]
MVEFLIFNSFAELMDENPHRANLICKQYNEYLSLSDESAIWSQVLIQSYFICLEIVWARTRSLIGLLVDVKHVAHIGWDGPFDTAPSWVHIIESPHLKVLLFLHGHVKVY